ncbi:MAG: alginate lyase family protein [Kiritimatiellales bacterium]
MKTGDCSKRIIRTGALVASSCFWAVSGMAGTFADKIPPAPEIPATILMDGRILAASKQRILAGDTALMPAFTNLIQDAEKAMKEGPFSVMKKTKLPPGGDKHDYASYARYWWPNPAASNGLPYIQRDGQTNPDSQSPAESDRIQLDKLVAGVETLGLAYYLTGEERYAGQAAMLLQTWFLAPETRMNPNLKFSQGIPGKADGTKSGVIDGRIFCRALEGAILISKSPALSPSEHAALRDWAAQYLNWLKTDRLAQDEAATKNNHGTFFDAQIMYFAIFAGEPALARQVAEESVKRRILAQIEPDGTQPKELDRTRTFHYNAFNLQAMFMLARLAEQVGVDLWRAGDSRMKAAMDFLAPYADPARPWPYPDMDGVPRIELLPLLLQAAAVYKDDTYTQMLDKLSPAEKAVRRENLAVPLMR